MPNYNQGTAHGGERRSRADGRRRQIQQNRKIDKRVKGRFSGRSNVSEITDPVEEFAAKLKSTGNKDDWLQGRKYDPTLRTFAPVIVRGAEHEGVKFWGFGKTVYQELLGIIADPDYGDITDAINGRDIVIERQTPAEAGNQYGKTTIRVKPNQVPLTDDKKQLEEICNSHVDITELWEEPSYDDLKEALRSYLNPTDDTDTTITSNGVTVSASPTINTGTATTDTTKKTDDVGDAFDSLFNN